MRRSRTFQALKEQVPGSQI